MQITRDSFTIAVIPGAVPILLSIGTAPLGIITWTTLACDIFRPRLWKNSSSVLRHCSSSTSSVPSTSASAWRVRSSGVGPSPPETRTISARPIASPMAEAISPALSPTVWWETVGIPIAISLSANHAEFVSTVRPQVSSSPVDINIALML